MALRLKISSERPELPASRPRGRWAPWWPVIRAVEDEDSHPSRHHLAALIARYGVPPWAREYVAARLSEEEKPPGRRREYPRPGSWERAHGISPRKSCAVATVHRLHHRFAQYETRDRRIGNEGRRFRWLNEPVKLRWIESRGVWRIKAPKVQALRLVARRYYVSPATVEGWERRMA